MKKKLKKKIWVISTIILSVYIGALIIKPTIWLALIPIIIPTTLLTTGIPTYAIIKNKKENIKNSYTKVETNNKINEETKSINKTIADKPTTNIEINKLEEPHIETNIEKVKVKTKGTRF